MLLLNRNTAIVVQGGVAVVDASHQVGVRAAITAALFLVVKLQVLVKDVV